MVILNANKPSLSQDGGILSKLNDTHAELESRREVDLERSMATAAPVVGVLKTIGGFVKTVKPLLSADAGPQVIKIMAERAVARRTGGEPAGELLLSLMPATYRTLLFKAEDLLDFAIETGVIPSSLVEDHAKCLATCSESFVGVQAALVKNEND